MSNSLKILVVEDEALTALELQKKLVSWNYDVTEIVSSGEKALEKALELKPDLILMDILLKGEMTGIDAAREIKNKIEIPIIYLTAYCNSETFEGAKITQPNAYLIKPFQEHELKFAIEMAFHGHQSQLKLRESEARYRILAESTPDMIFIINKDLVVDYVNETSVNYLKQSKAEIIGKSLKQIFPGNIFELQKKTLQEIFRTGKSSCLEDLIEFPEGELWLNTCFKPLKNYNGEIHAIMGISRDISQYKKIQEEFKVQNNLNTDLIENLTYPIFYKDEVGLYQVCNLPLENEKRVRVMALLFKKIASSEDLNRIDFGDYLRTMGRMLIDFDEFKQDNIDYQVNSQLLFLNIDHAIAMALIANELISNSLKHAFPNENTGMINVQLNQEGPYLIMRVSDNGVGLPNDFNFRKSENLGFKIVKNILEEINGEIELKNEDGVNVIIKVPNISSNAK